MIPFNKPFMTGKELFYISEAHFNGVLSGDGPFTHNCHDWLEQRTGTKKALLTHSCTAALEMTAILADLCLGDEVIMPSYTFVSTANAFVLRGAVPVFVDIRPDTLNIDEMKIEEAITNKTRAIVPVHYAGVACEMDVIMDIASRYDLLVIEDAAQGIMSTYKGRALGSIGHFGTLSFHETKNIISGEGGAILINDESFIERAEIIREKGTNRSQFFQGKIDKYTWVDIGSSYLPGEIVSAFLWAQMEEAKKITETRLAVWSYYHEALVDLECNELIKRPTIPKGCEHNAHMYYVVISECFDRADILNKLTEAGINSVFHYIPLHLSSVGNEYGRVSGVLSNTERQAKCLIRLPMWTGLQKSAQQRVVDSLYTILR